jgi:hypothetical protein
MNAQFKHQDAYDLLGEILKDECRRGPIWYFANPGNWGDGLIRAGTLRFFNDIYLDYKELRDDKKGTWLIPRLRGGTVIYGGGGGWCNNFGVGEQVVTRLLQARFKVIVLPSTYQRTFSFPSTQFFRRDQFESKECMPESIFCHDMAFYLGKHRPSPGGGYGCGYFFRTDSESANRLQIPKGNVDISAMGNQYTDVEALFRQLNRFASIHTDRLHVSIAACLLGKEVHLYSGSYFKNRAVYLSSMKNYFDKISFCSDFRLF